MKPLIALASLTVCSLSSCSVMMDAVMDNAFESSRDRKIREDSRNLKEGRPLEHYSSEKRLRVAREDRLLDELMSE